jgi:hypothetical protein
MVTPNMPKKVELSPREKGNTRCAMQKVNAGIHPPVSSPRQAAMRPPDLNICITCWTVVIRLDFLVEMPAVPLAWLDVGVVRFKVVDTMFSFEGNETSDFRMADFQSRPLSVVLG